MEKLKIILVLLVVFVSGAAGGIWSQAYLLPFMASHERFENMRFVQDWNARTTVIQPTERVVVTEGESREMNVEQGQEMTVLVRSVVGGQTFTGSGLIVTNDGMVIAPIGLVPQGASVDVHMGSGTEYGDVEVVDRDTGLGLALLRLDATGLRTASFASQDDILLGSSFVVTAKSFEDDELVLLANNGMLTRLSEQRLETSLGQVDSEFHGAPLFARNGDILGLMNRVSSDESDVIPAPVLRSYLNGYDQ